MPDFLANGLLYVAVFSFDVRYDNPSQGVLIFSFKLYSTPRVPVVKISLDMFYIHDMILMAFAARKSCLIL